MLDHGADSGDLTLERQALALGNVGLYERMCSNLSAALNSEVHCANNLRVDYAIAVRKREDPCL